VRAGMGMARVGEGKEEMLEEVCRRGGICGLKAGFGRGLVWLEFCNLHIEDEV
jgi:hypothetical protein